MDNAEQSGDGQTSESTVTVGLALSGGGFRATLFHLGVLRCLKDRGCLENVTLVTSVSGGSIVAAHLARFWDEYVGDNREFDEAAGKLISFTKSDLRGRMIRRLILSYALVIPRLIGRMTLARSMESSLNRLYEKANIQALRTKEGGCEIHILATSLTTGGLCSFDFEGFVWTEDNERKSIKHNHIPLARAVAASAAFPPLFPAVPFTKEMLNADYRQMDKTQYLTDGGIFDNLGLEELARLATAGASSRPSVLIVSDAGGNFDWNVGEAYASLIPRNVRATDILMDRVSRLVPALASHGDLPICHIFIGTELAASEGAIAQAPEVQRAVRNIRTDLDAFSSKEVRALVRQGYGAASAALTRSRIGQSASPSTWDLLNASEQASELKIADAKRRKIRLFSWKDPVTYANLLLLTLWAVLFALVPLFWAYRAGLRADPPSVAHIEVTDTNGKPVRDATVKVRSEGSLPSTEITDDQGFTLVFLPSEAGQKTEVFLDVEATGYQRLEVERNYSELSRATLKLVLQSAIETK